MGVIGGVSAISRVPVVVVSRVVWESSFGLVGAAKDAGRLLAIDLFAGSAHHLKLKKHHNRADALLLAEYGRRIEA